MASRFDILTKVPYLKVWDQATFSREGTFTLWGNVRDLVSALVDIFQPTFVEINEDCIYLSYCDYVLSIYLQDGTWNIEEEI